MNKLILFIGLGLTSFTTVKAQTVLTRSDFGQIGDSIRYEADTTITSGALNVGSAGVSQTWNFTSGFTAELTDLAVFRDPSANPSAPAGTNISVFSKLEGVFDFQVDSQVVRNLRANPLGGPDLAFRIMDFPMTYGKQFADSVQLGFKGAGADFNFPQVDSVWYKIDVINRVHCDAYGSLTTPKGTYNVLRVRNKNEQKITVLGKGLITLYQWVPLYNQNNVENIYTYLGNNAKYFVAKCVADSAGNVRAFSYQSHLTQPSTGLASTATQSSFVDVYPNPANDQLFLQFQAAPEKVQIELTDVTGRIMEQRFVILGGLLSVDIREIPSGLYFCKVSGNDFSETHKVLIRK
ncbi:MAG: T9SS type A sorting domain-containing protein [Bacteroidia bacterium]|jgi:hypothetical protein